MPHHILLAGGTGTIGKDLVGVLLAAGHQVRLLTRQTSALPLATWAATAGVPATRLEQAHWNPAAQELAPVVFQGVTAVMNLAGEGVADKRWFPARKKAILESRTQANATLLKAYQAFVQRSKQLDKDGASAGPAPVFIVSSAIGWYGPDKNPPQGFQENEPAAADFLGQTCWAWENSSLPFVQLGCRRVVLRTGIVLSTRGGALPEFLKPLAFRVAAALGGGQQIISWIHVKDLCRQYLWALENPSVEGIYNAVAPHPVSQKTMMEVLAKACCGKFYLRAQVPAFFLRWVLGEMSVEVLKSTTVSADKALQAGFVFSFPSLEPAVADLVQHP